MTASSPAFSFLYDVRALTLVHALFGVWAPCVGVWLIRRRARPQLLLDVAAITAIAAAPRRLLPEDELPSGAPLP